jgi:hypothetical protein
LPMDHRLTFLSSPPVTMTPLDLRPILRQLTADWCALNSCGDDGTDGGWGSGILFLAIARVPNAGPEHGKSQRRDRGTDLQAIRAFHHGATRPSAAYGRESMGAQASRGPLWSTEDSKY